MMARKRPTPDAGSAAPDSTESVPQTNAPEPAKVTLPFDASNEAAIVAWCFLDAATRTRLLARFTPNAFQQSQHRDLWTVFSLAEQKKLVVDLALVEQLGTTALATYIAELSGLRPSEPKNLAFHVQNLTWDAARLAAARGPVPAFLEALRDPKRDPRDVQDLARSVANSIAGYGSASSAFTFKNATSLASPPPMLPPLCRGLGLLPGRPILLAGYGGTGKTMLALDLGLAVATDAPSIWGVPIERHGVVRHIDWECGPQMIGTRTIRIAAGRGLDLRALGDRYQSASLPRTYITDKCDVVLRELAEGAALVILDSMAASFRLDAPENSSAFREPLDVMTRVSCETGCVFLVLVHESKNSPETKGRPQVQRVRGSGAITDGSGGVLSVSVDSRGVLTIAQSRMSQSKPGAPTRVRIVDEGPEDLTLCASAKLLIEHVKDNTNDDDESEIDHQVDAANVERAKVSLLAVLTEHPTLGKKELIRRARGRTDSKRQALDELIDAGVVVQAPGLRGAKLLRLAKENSK